MPMIRRLPGAVLLAASLAALAASPLPAQTIVAEIPGAMDVPVTVPFMNGADYPAMLGPSRRGAVGQPRAFARLKVQLLVEPACSVHAISGEPILIQCSGAMPYLAAIGSDADPDDTASFASALPAAPRTPPSMVVVQRLTVDY
jgi:hypothetical protein